METVPDTELMLRYKRDRSQAAFAELVSRYQKSLVNFFYRLCWESNMAEDLAQEVFIRVAQNARHYKPAARFNTFLYTIARSVWVDYFRSRKSQPETVSLDKPARKDSDKETAIKDGLKDSQPTPPEIITGQETMMRIKEVINQMPDDQGMIINLCLFEEMSYEEVADVLKLPVGTVKSRLHYALLKLKELIKL